MRSASAGTRITCRSSSSRGGRPSRPWTRSRVDGEPDVRFPAVGGQRAFSMNGRSGAPPVRRGFLAFRCDMYCNKHAAEEALRWARACLESPPLRPEASRRGHEGCSTGRRRRRIRNLAPRQGPLAIAKGASGRGSNRDSLSPATDDVKRSALNARLATLAPARRGWDYREGGRRREGRSHRLCRSRGRLARGPGDRARTVDCGERWITPGLIDCHTHLVFGGDRAAEFEMRLAGASYEEIARAGGGILSTVMATRAATEDALVASALQASRCPDRRGGDDRRGQIGLRPRPRRGAQVAARRPAPGRDAAGHHRDDVSRRSCRSAGICGDRDAYLDRVVGEIIPALAGEGLVEAVDAFCERIAFTPWRSPGVRGGPRSTCRSSCTPTNCRTTAARRWPPVRRAFGRPSGIHRRGRRRRRWRRAGSVAVLLPGAFYFLREPQPPPIELAAPPSVPSPSRPTATRAPRPLTSRPARHEHGRDASA